MTPYYDEDGITIYHGDVVSEWLGLSDLPGDVMVTDPPYGICYESGHFGRLERSIVGDNDTRFRDSVLFQWGDRPALVFGTWRAARPTGTRMVLVWDTKGALGMGDLCSFGTQKALSGWETCLYPGSQPTKRSTSSAPGSRGGERRTF